MQIQKISMRELRLPLKERFEISSGTVIDRRILLLQMETGDGLVCWSECVAGESPNYSAETIDTAWMAIREWLAPRVLGREFEEPGAVHEALNEHVRGHPMAKAAIEMGSWELAAQLRSLPLARLLGGTREAVAAGISLGIQASPTAVAERARAALERGYARIKIKVKPHADLDTIAAVREAVGTEAKLMVDANGAYRREDLGHLKKFDRFGLMMLEQPLEPDNLLGHAELQKELKTPICLDESIVSAQDAASMLALRSGKIVNIKPGRVAGLTASLAIYEFCRQWQVPVWCGGMLESGVGRAYNVALASLPHFTLPGDLSPSERYWERDIVQPEWQMDDHGMVAVPMDRPGMGVMVDVDRVENLTVREIALTHHSKTGRLAETTGA